MIEEKTMSKTDREIPESHDRHDLNLLTLGESSVEKFFVAAKEYKNALRGSQYLLNIAESDQARGILRVSIPGSHEWFDIPSAAIQKISPITISSEHLQSVLAAIKFKDELKILDQTLRILASRVALAERERSQTGAREPAVEKRGYSGALHFLNDRRSERWLSYYPLALPAGEFEVEVGASSYTTQLIVDDREHNYDLYVGMGATRWFHLQKPQEIRFQLENDPILPTVWESQLTTGPLPSPSGGKRVTYSYGEGIGDVTFRYSYGGTGAGLVPGGTRVLAQTGIVNSPPNSDQWSRGMSAFVHGTDPESWVRGSASIDRSNGNISHTLQLETDSVEAGPKGRITVNVYDVAGRKLATTSAEAGMGGKPPGRAVIRNFTGQTQIPTNIAKAAQSVTVSVEHLGRQFGLFGVGFGDVLNAIQLIFLIGSLG